MKGLQCQEYVKVMTLSVMVLEYVKSATKADLPETFIVPDELYVMEKTLLESIKEEDVALTFGRLDLSDIQTGSVKATCENQDMPSWSAFNSLVSEDCIYSTQELPEYSGTAEANAHGNHGCISYPVEFKDLTL